MNSNQLILIQTHQVFYKIKFRNSFETFLNCFLAQTTFFELRNLLYCSKGNLL